jgi:exopolysaccharide biosynthesis protein
METYKASEFDAQKAIKGGVYQTWDFGPALLDRDGKAISEFTTGIAGKNPRCAIGYYEPGHYCLVLVDGRQEGYSMGLTLTELAQLFEDMGCKRAYNLDGGQSANMAYLGKLHNVPTRGGREVSDLIYIWDDVEG